MHQLHLGIQGHAGRHGKESPTWQLQHPPPPPSSHTQISDITRLFTEKVHPPRYRYLTSVLRFRNGSQPQEKTKIHDLIPRVNTVIRTRVRKMIRIFLDLERNNYVYVRTFQLI